MYIEHHHPIPEHPNTQAQLLSELYRACLSILHQNGMSPAVHQKLSQQTTQRIGPR